MSILCPDGGTCHHHCDIDYCFRVDCCAPFDDIYEGAFGEWPDDIKVKYGGEQPQVVM